MAKIGKDELQKALQRLDTLAKSQLYHSPSDSEPGNWAGSTPDGQDAYDDMIDENGTDYNGVKKALASKVAKGQKLTSAEVAIVKGENPAKFIAAKIEKGSKLTSAESWFLKAGAGMMMPMGKPSMAKADEKPSEAGEPGEQKDASSAPQTHAGSEDDADAKERDATKGYGSDGDDDEDDKAEKSFGRLSEESNALKGGVEISPFLAELVRTIDIALRNNESSVSKAIRKSLSSVASRIEALEKAQATAVAEDNEFKKALAEAITGIGQQVAGVASMAVSEASAPARGPKSQFRNASGAEGSLEKSLGGTDTLTKSQIVDVMSDLCVKGEIPHLEVIKYEHTGQLNPQLQKKVFAAAAAGAR